MDAYLGGPILISTDSGLNWSVTDTPITNWHGIASSTDGNRFVAVAGGTITGGQIYTAQTVQQPVLSIEGSGTSLVLSWVIPSRDFVLQQSSDLALASWSDVPIVPVSSWSTLRNEVRIPLPTTPLFFRLASR